MVSVKPKQRTCHQKSSEDHCSPQSPNTHRGAYTLDAFEFPFTWIWNTRASLTWLRTYDFCHRLQYSGLLRLSYFEFSHTVSKESMQNECLGSETTPLTWRYNERHAQVQTPKHCKCTPTAPQFKEVLTGDCPSVHSQSSAATHRVSHKRSENSFYD